MNDLISRAELFNRLANVQDMAKAYAVIQDMPTIEERKKGKWETEIRSNRDGTRSAYYACSVCGVYALDEYKFCPNCGADMRGEQDGHEREN